jgi:hypothetical protein
MRTVVGSASANNLSGAVIRQFGQTAKDRRST